MKTQKVKVLKNHTIDMKTRAKGTEYLLAKEKVPFCVKMGYVEVIIRKKKKDESTNRGN